MGFSKRLLATCSLFHAQRLTAIMLIKGLNAVDMSVQFLLTFKIAITGCPNSSRFRVSHLTLAEKSPQLRIELAPHFIIRVQAVGLGVTYSPRDPRFAGSSPAEVDGFFQDVKILSTSPSEGT